MNGSHDECVWDDDDFNVSMVCVSVCIEVYTHNLFVVVGCVFFLCFFVCLLVSKRAKERIDFNGVSVNLLNTHTDLLYMLSNGVCVFQIALCDGYMLGRKKMISSFLLFFLWQSNLEWNLCLCRSKIARHKVTKMIALTLHITFKPKSECTLRKDDA